MKKFRPLEKFSLLPTWLVSLTHPKVACWTIYYISTVAKDFFILQFLRKFKFIRTPIVHVDNPLDAKVPFNTRKIADYLGFVKYWIRPLGLLIQTLGANRAAPHLAEFYRAIRKAYKSAADVYRFRFSTTDRPHYKRRIYFAGVHLLDPHYLCVPSLHIAVVCLTYTFMRKVFEEENYSAEEKESWSRDLYAGAVNIAETVLYVKQHSVNCVSAALYMMASVFPSLFTQKDALEFLDSMFKNAQDIPQDDIKLILDYMKSIFLQFMEQGQNSKDWSEPLKKWLIKCEKRADNS